MRTLRVVPTFAIVLASVLAIAIAPEPARAHPGTGILVDRAGNVYFVLLGEPVIMRRTPDGRVEPFVSDPRLSAPHHLVWGESGEMYVASDNDGVVWRVSAAGALTRHLNSYQTRRASDYRQFQAGAWGDPFTVGADGAVYALARPGWPEIIRVDTGGGIVPFAGKRGIGNLHFSGMALGPDGALYVTDERRVWRFTRDGGTLLVSRALEQASGIALDADGQLLVADYAAGRIARFSPNGAETTPPEFRRLRLRHPTGIAVSGGDIYVLDHAPFSTAIWRLRGEAAERIYVRREAGAYGQWVVPAVPVLLLVLLVLNRRQRRKAGIIASPA